MFWGHSLRIQFFSYEYKPSVSGHTSGKIPSRLFLGVEFIDPKCKTKVPQAKQILVRKIEGESISIPSSKVLRSSASIPIVRISLLDSFNPFFDPHMSSGQLHECDLSGPRAPCLRRQDRTRRRVMSTISRTSPRGEVSTPGCGLP